ncbi:MAG TPA: thiol reductant ABC exporter subunit CydC [Candidatus Dormibacteraeota bacterium]
MTGRSHDLRRVLGLIGPARGGLALAALFSSATVAAGVGLMATAAYSISRAALVTSFVEIQVALAGVRTFALSRGAFRYLERYTAHAVSFQMLARLRVWFYSAIEPLAPGVLWRHSGGDLLTRIVADIEALEQLAVRVLMPAAAALIAGTAACLFLALFDPRLGIIVLGALTLMGLVVPLAARRAASTAAQAQVACRAELGAAVVDGVQGVAELLAFDRESSHLGRLEEIGGRLHRAERRLALVRGLSAATAALLGSLTMVAVLLVAIPLVSAGHLDPVYLAAVPLTALAALEAAAPLPAAIEHLERSLAAAARLFELVDARPAVLEPEVSGPPPAAGTIELRNLRFAYGPGESPVLDGLDLSVAPGERVAIVGASGAGKTTLVNLLLRFWEAQGGCIRIGGSDVRQSRSEDVRALFSVVAQDTHLFGGTVRANLLLARPEASEDQVVAACRQANIHQVVERLPLGYDTWIGENGLLLSGGERQRLSVARAILKDAPVLLLDEPTAHLDSETEAGLLDGIQTLMAGRTVIAVGHQPLASAIGARVVVLDRGRLRPEEELGGEDQLNAC